MLTKLSTRVAFRDQDLADIPIEKALEFGGYFGRHHIHPTSGAPKGFPEIHLVHRGADDNSYLHFLKEHTNSVTWHSDVSYEAQPPGTTFLYLLDGPTSGGDTLFANLAKAYERLSPEFRKRLHGLKAVHSGFEQAQSAIARQSTVRRDPVQHEHPLVRTHPVTGEKALYINPQCKLTDAEPDAEPSFIFFAPSSLQRNLITMCNSHPLHCRL